MINVHGGEEKNRDEREQRERGEFEWRSSARTVLKRQSCRRSNDEISFNKYFDVIEKCNELQARAPQLEFFRFFTFYEKRRGVVDVKPCHHSITY
jgi:hypothetical protein